MQAGTIRKVPSIRVVAGFVCGVLLAGAGGYGIRAIADTTVQHSSTAASAPSSAARPAEAQGDRWYLDTTQPGGDRWYLDPTR